MIDRKEISLLVVMILVCFAILALFGCVPVSKYRRDIKQTRIETWQKARKIAYWQHCDDAVFIIGGKIAVEEMRK